MVGIVSHDLRNPLSTIQINAVLLGRRSADTQVVLGRINRAADRATRVIGDLLDFTRARLGTGEVEAGVAAWASACTSSARSPNRTGAASGWNLRRSSEPASASSSGASPTGWPHEARATLRRKVDRSSSCPSQCSPGLDLQGLYLSGDHFDGCHSSSSKKGAAIRATLPVACTSNSEARGPFCIGCRIESGMTIRRYCVAPAFGFGTRICAL
jgi:hypothetical protein